MEDKKILKLDKYEYGTIANIIVEKRNNMLKANQDTEYITEILEKVINAPSKKEHHFKRERQKCER